MLEEVEFKKYTCKRCGHVWYSRLEHPKVCPKCKSYNWDRLLESAGGGFEHVCKRCGLVWRSSLEHPKECPRCKRADWDIEARHWVCYLCKHEWTTVKREEMHCPKCGQSFITEVKPKASSA